MPATFLDSHHILMYLARVDRVLSIHEVTRFAVTLQQFLPIEIRKSGLALIVIAWITPK